MQRAMEGMAGAEWIGRAAEKQPRSLPGGGASMVPPCIARARFADTDGWRAAQKLVDTGMSRFEHVITVDLPRTFPNHVMFVDKDGTGQQSLYNVLKAYASYDHHVGACFLVWVRRWRW